MATSLPPAQAMPLLPARTLTSTVTAGADTWRYADEARTHEVQMALRRDPSPALVIRERAVGSQDPRDLYEIAVPMEGAWEMRLHHFALELRLSLLGSYHRATGNGAWSPLRRNADNRRLQLEPLLMEEDRGAEFHWYGSRHHDVTALLIATRVRTTHGGARYHLSRVIFRFPDVDQGEAVVLHPHLPPVLLRSVLAQHDLEYQELGMEKLVYVDRSARGNAEWCARLDGCLAAAQARIRRAAYGGAAPRIPHPSQRQDAPRQRVPVRSYEVEDAEPVVAERAGPAVKKVEDVEISWREALQHPRLLALHRRYLAAGEEAALIARGDIAIRKFISVRRSAASVEEQHFISILEASLLTRYALSPSGTHRVDPVMGDLLRRSLAYL